MTGRPDPTRALAAVLKKEVREEIRDLHFFEAPRCVHEVPTPVAEREERALVGALLAGHVGLGDVVPMTACDCYYHLNAAILVALEAIDVFGCAVTIPLVIVALRAQDVGGSDESLATQLHELVEESPEVLDVIRLVDAVVEAASKRRLLRRLRDAEVEVATSKRSAAHIATELVRELGEYS